MLTLVKTLKTLCLSGPIDWAGVSRRVMGVHDLDGASVGMSFRVEGHGRTRLHSTKSGGNSVAVVTRHEDSVSPGDVAEGAEQGLLYRILEAAGVNGANPAPRTLEIVRTVNNYFVFRVVDEPGSLGDVCDLTLLEHGLNAAGIATIMDFHIHDALVADVSGVTWHFFAPKEKTIVPVAIVGGSALRESARTVRASWDRLVTTIIASRAAVVDQTRDEENLF